MSQRTTFLEDTIRDLKETQNAETAKYDE